MIDSGAYSAWMKGKTIDVNDYISFLKSVAHVCATVVNLDVIPGRPKQYRGPEEVEASAEASYENFQRMKAEGLRPMPVVHYGEDLYWLDRLLKEGETYIGLSAGKGWPTRESWRWLDEAFERLTDSAGQPLVKVHGFGITRHHMLSRYPWTTVDSTTWSMSAGYGRIYVPRVRYDGQQVWDCPPLIPIVSCEEQGKPSLSEVANLTGRERGMLFRWLEECGVTFEQARDDDSVGQHSVLPEPRPVTVAHSDLRDVAPGERIRPRANGSRRT